MEMFKIIASPSISYPLGIHTHSGHFRFCRLEHLHWSQNEIWTTLSAKMFSLFVVSIF